MAGLIYILDTNAIADYLNGIETTTNRIDQALDAGSHLYLAQPVVYEVLRGLLKVNAVRKLHVFEQEFAPQFDKLDITDADWQQAAL